MTDPAPKPTLSPYQLAALRSLSNDPAARVEPATLSKLRKLGLAGRKVEKATAANGYRQKTTSPVTEAGMALLAP